jgi:hypothetical protein
MMLAGVLLLITFMLTALSPRVNTTSGDIFNSSGIDLFVNELFLLAAAGVGAAFAGLFRANRYIADGTYDPKYESSYWVRFILGIIAGIVLAVLIPVGPNGKSFTRPLLALLGGFSASVVYRILGRIVDTLESFIEGDSPEASAAREQALRSKVLDERAQEQLRLGAALMKLRHQLGAGASQEELEAAVSSILDDLLPAEGTDLGPAVGAWPDAGDAAAGSS